MRNGVLIRLLGKGGNQGFTLIELLIVVLIVGILAAVATPLYLGYVRDAKTTEGKSIAGAVWTSAQANALAACGNAVDASLSFPRAGLNGNPGVTADGRWSVTSSGTVTIACGTGLYTVTSPLFTVTGLAQDVSVLRVRMTYTAAGTPPAVLQCSADSGTSWVNC